MIYGKTEKEYSGKHLTLFDTLSKRDYNISCYFSIITYLVLSNKIFNKQGVSKGKSK